MAKAFFVAAGDVVGGVERYFVYDPNGVAGGNVYTDWAALCTTLAALPKGEQPIVAFRSASAPISIPVAGMPVGGWPQNGATWVSDTLNGGFTKVAVDAGAQLDNLAGIADGMWVQITPGAGTGVLNFTDTYPVFKIGLGSLVDNQGLGALIVTPGGGTTTALALVQSVQNAPSIAPALVGPLVALAADDSVVLTQNSCFGGAPPNWLTGGGAGALLFVLTDSTGTLPSSWIGYAATPTTVLSVEQQLAGLSANRPSFANLQTGTMYFDTGLGLPIWWDGAIWVDAAGAPV